MPPATPTLDPTSTSAWAALRSHAEHLSSLHLASLLEAPGRYAELRLAVGNSLLADFSRCRLTTETLTLLNQLAEECGVTEARAALFAGELVNNTEGRAALHMSLRATADTGPLLGDLDVGAAVTEERAKVLAFAESVRDGTRLSSAEVPFRTVINIGIGGSDLGPRFVTAALAQAPPVAVHYVAGLDGMELSAALRDAEPATTLFIVCSKTFTTLETLTNARAARAWLLASLTPEAAVRHFAAVSVNTAAMDDFGVADDARFDMWDWVGGRYSVWSPVGLAAAIALGGDAFRELLAGAASMDQHFRDERLQRNLPVRMALTAVWQQNFLGLDQHVVLPYDQRLVGLPDYLQQLWMESLGKSVRKDGVPTRCTTGAALWGNGGSCAQHSFAQWLHQGDAPAAVDYIGTARGPADGDVEAHLQSLANMIAQAEVLARGRPVNDPDDWLEPHREHPGNRPALVLLLRRLTPYTLGQLLAAYEHSVFVQSVIWGINAFDQFGVEQGKLVARSYAGSLLDGRRDELPGIGSQILDWQSEDG